MHQLPTEQQILLALEIGTLACLCVRMWRSGLHKIYTSFFVYLVLQFLQALIPFCVPFRSPLYRDLYVLSRMLILIFCALVVLELYTVVLHDLGGIAGIARRYIKVTLALGIALSLLPLGFEKAPDTPTGYLFILERPILSTLVVLILLISAFLVYYPIPLGWNVIACLAGYAVYCSAVATTVLLENMGYSWNREASNVDMGVCVACYVFWLFALSRRGEQKRVVVGHQWNPGDDQRLMMQLEAINASLLRSRGK